MPAANMEEIIPAARLLSRATALTHSDYERAKTAFLSGMDASGLAAQVVPGFCNPFCCHITSGPEHCYLSLADPTQAFIFITPPVPSLACHFLIQ